MRPAHPSIWQLLWQLIRYAQRLYWSDTFLWLFILGLPAVPGLILREYFNTLTGDSALALSPWGWIALLLATGAARIVAIFAGRITKTQHRFMMSALVRHNLLGELLKRPGAEPLRLGPTGPTVAPGEVLSYFRDDVSQIEDTVVGTNEVFGAGVFALVSLGILLSVNWAITLLVFLPLCAIAALAHQAEHRLKRYRRASRQATQQVTGLIGELLSAVQAIKVAGAEAPVLSELERRCHIRQRLMVRDRVFSAVLDSGFENIISLGTGLVLLLAAQFMQSGQDPLSVGDLALFIYNLSFVTYFMSFLGGFLAVSKQSEVSFERMGELVGGWRGGRVDEREQGSGAGERGEPGEDSAVSSSTPYPSIPYPSTPHPSLALVAPNPLYLQDLLGRMPNRLPLQQRPLMQIETLQTLRAVGLTYRYPDTGGGISDINLTLKRGSLTVITGPVGAGKTTLLRVLLGLLSAQAGTVYWNQQQVEQPECFFVPPRSAYTPQIPELFSATLRENLLLGLEVSSERVEGAIATAIFDRDLATMPEGLNTLIGTRGLRLSGGQKQRAAAARMLLRQSELLVFDDLSSALDVETEQQLWAKLFEGRAGRQGSQGARTDSAPLPSHPSTPTCLVVSHRPAVLQKADWVLVLDQGRVQCEGPPSEVLSHYPELAAPSFEGGS
ncbi:ABC transporter ATP-binding protein [Pseudanabaena sp. FACHB-2040]|uniref:ATP-binding cassette domain-containing protein n=1 Tax=Pseudanabaena sp. FACHB-2040 TaxID=2692859 RepID=UPI00168611F3|nr:ABC transporter ATP-binding protein [Pseudanabaena sp. FACHB-2040]MBD2258233.1 ABC transporter ATP-binding protein [Pseudanabaena sp. FACHB-2040]